MKFQDILKARPIQAAHLVKDFAAFCRWAWPLLHPGAKLSWTVGHDLICEHLVAVYRGLTKRLIVNCPPRFAKSTIVTICYPVWCWLQDPTKAFLCASYEIDLSQNHNLERRRLMDQDEFKQLFGDRFQLSTDRSQAGEFSNNCGGRMHAASVNSRAMGRGGDTVILDDPLSSDAAHSESIRNETNAWLQRTLPQRLNHPSQSAIVVVMQRLHMNDPTGFLLAQQESDWLLLKLPLICEEAETITFPISGRIWKRRKGDCLDPTRWTAKTIRNRQGNRLVWSGQFQQSPVPTTGNLIRVDEILYFGGRDPTGALDPGLPESFERKIISVDASFKDKSTSDYVAIVVVGVVGARRYLLHVTNAKLDLTGTECEVRNLHSVFGPISAVLVEGAANGASVIAHLKDEISGMLEINPEGGKVARLVATSPEFQAGNWLIERNGPWTHMVVAQLTMFPLHKNDDIVDAISQAAIWLQKNTFELGLLDYAKKVSAEIAVGLRNPFGQRLNPRPKPVPVVAMKPSITRVDNFAATAKPNDECPNCKTTFTFVQQDSQGRMRLHCRHCAAIDGILPAKPIVGDICPVEGCDIKMHWSGGSLRCKSHGQPPIPMGNLRPMTINGVSRSAFAAANTIESRIARVFGKYW
jgi:predicted phage terminase large subunit-like protein